MKNRILADKIKSLRAGADETREHLGAETFDLKKVVALMAAATAKGYRAVKISPPVPVELNGTKAAKELVRELKEAGADVEWVTRAPSDAVAGERFSELVVKW